MFRMKDCMVQKLYFLKKWLGQFDVSLCEISSIIPEKLLSSWYKSEAHLPAGFENYSFACFDVNKVIDKRN
jgi:hypothetical protein